MAGGSARLFGDRDFYHGDWLLRAAAAKAGIYGNDAVEAMYPMTRSRQHRPAARRQQAQLHAHLRPGSVPPVNAFWSVTMYDGKTQLLIENPINRYLINSPMLPEHEEERGRLADDLHPERFAGQGQGIQLAARPERADLSGDAALLAEDDAAFDPAAGRRHMAASRCETGFIERRLLAHRVICCACAQVVVIGAKRTCPKSVSTRP